MCCICLPASAQNSNVGIGTTTPHQSALLEEQTATQGLLIPRMTQVQRDAITSPATGLLIYATDSVSPSNPATFYYYNGSRWLPFVAIGSGWTLSGNSGTTANSNYAGTSDAVDFIIKTNGIERIRIYSSGNLLLANSNNTAQELQFQEPSGSGTHYSSFKAGAMSANISYTLPTAQSNTSATDVIKSWLENNGTGDLRWAGEHHYNVETKANITSATNTNINNYSINPDATYVRLSSNNDVNITGITGGTDGRLLVVMNVGTSGDITLLSNNAGSAAANRIFVRAAIGGKWTLTPGGGFTYLIYDATSSIWRVLF